jgi:hypothetical protein
VRDREKQMSQAADLYAFALDSKPKFSHYALIFEGTQPYLEHYLVCTNNRKLEQELREISNRSTSSLAGLFKPSKIGSKNFLTVIKNPRRRRNDERHQMGTNCSASQRCRSSRIRNLCQQSQRIVE